MNIDYKALGKRIKAARHIFGSTQEELADKVSFSVSHLSNIETGNARVSLDKLVLIANILNTTTDALLCDSLLHEKASYGSVVEKLLEDCSPSESQFLTDSIDDLKERMKTLLDKNMEDEKV